MLKLPANYLKNLVIFFIIVPVLGLALPMLVHGQAVEPSVNRPAADLGSALIDIKNDAAKIEDHNSILLRRQVVYKIIGFTKLEIVDLRKKVADLSDLEGNEAALQSQFLSKLDNFLRQLNNFNDVLNSLDGIEEIKAIAASLRGWRDVYLAETKKMKEWILYYQIFDLSKKANERYVSVSTEILSFENRFSNFEEIRLVLDKASTSLSLANEALSQAQGSIIHFYLDSDYKFSSREFELPGALLTKALLQVKDAYLAFLELGMLLGYK